MSLIGSMLRPRNDGDGIQTSLQLDRWLRRGTPTASGATVNPDTAVTVATVWACARMIAEDIGKLPFPVYRPNPDGGKAKATDSPFWRIVHDRMSSNLTSQQTRELLTLHALLRGNGYALKTVVAGQVREIVPLDPTRVRVEQHDDFSLTYWVRLADKSEAPLTRREVFHLMGPSLDGVTGASVVTLARQAIGNAMATQEYAGRFFGNGAHPGGYIQADGAISPEAAQRLKEDWEDVHAGLANSHRVGVLENGTKYVPIALSAEDSQMLESRKFDVEEIARWFRVPQHKVGHLERTTFSNIEQQAIEYVTDTLMPWGVRWDHAVNQQVIVTDKIYAEINFEGLLRGDTATRYAAHKSAIEAGWETHNEARLFENLNPIEGLDEPLVALNMGPASQLGQTPEPQGVQP